MKSDCRMTSPAIDTTSAVADTHAGTYSGPGSGQPGLFSEDIAPESEAEVTAGESRMFFPCNREDALVLFAGLCISEFFPDTTVRLAVQEGGIALVRQGIRTLEEELLQGGKPERFTVLAEVASVGIPEMPRIVGYHDIVRLVFRTQEEADAFRYRPVDEFDTGALEWAVDPSCFGHDGPSRFHLRPKNEPAGVWAGHTVDRLTAAIHYIASLGEIQPRCRLAISQFIERNNSGTGGEADIDLDTACRVLTGSATGEPVRLASAIIGSFHEVDDPTPRILIDGIAERFSRMPAPDDGTRDIEQRWTKIARDVARNSVALDGTLLADSGSFMLRGALLALVADSPAALGAFLDACKPSGPGVTSTAAFLVGLKQGLISCPWKLKRESARQLSAVAAALLRTALTDPDRLQDAIGVLESEDEDSVWQRVMAGDIVVAEWKIAKPKAPDVLGDLWRADFQRLGYQVKGKGLSDHSWMVTFPRGAVLEVVHCCSGSVRFPMLRSHFQPGQKLRKAKDIVAAFGAGGHLWQPRAGQDGRYFLCCELLVLPDFRDAELAIEALDHAAGLCLAEPKPVRKRKSPAVTSPPSGP